MCAVKERPHHHHHTTPTTTAITTLLPPNSPTPLPGPLSSSKVANLCQITRTKTLLETRLLTLPVLFFVTKKGVVHETTIITSPTFWELGTSESSAYWTLSQVAPVQASSTHRARPSVEAHDKKCGTYTGQLSACGGRRPSPRSDTLRSVGSCAEGSGRRARNPALSGLCPAPSSHQTNAVRFACLWEHTETSALRLARGCR